MKASSFHIPSAGLALVSTLLVAACGGGGSSSPAPVANAPAPQTTAPVTEPTRTNTPVDPCSYDAEKVACGEAVVKVIKLPTSKPIELKFIEAWAYPAANAPANTAPVKLTLATPPASITLEQSKVTSKLDTYMVKTSGGGITAPLSFSITFTNGNNPSWASVDGADVWSKSTKIMSGDIAHDQSINYANFSDTTKNTKQGLVFSSGKFINAQTNALEGFTSCWYVWDTDQGSGGTTQTTPVTASPGREICYLQDKASPANPKQADLYEYRNDGVYLWSAVLSVGPIQP